MGKAGDWYKVTLGSLTAFAAAKDVSIGSFAGKGGPVAEIWQVTPPKNVLEMPWRCRRMRWDKSHITIKGQVRAR